LISAKEVKRTAGEVDGKPYRISGDGWVRQDAECLQIDVAIVDSIKSGQRRGASRIGDAGLDKIGSAGFR